MASAIEILNGIVAGIIPGEQNFQSIESIYFFLIFILIFSISFTGTSYIPMFKNKKEYDNIRTIISISIAFLTTIGFFQLIVSQLQYIGLIAAITFGISIVILGLIPKDKRDKVSSGVVFIGALIALLIVLIYSFGVDWLINIWNYIYGNFTNPIVIGIIIVMAIVGIIAGIIKSNQGP